MAGAAALLGRPGGSSARGFPNDPDRCPNSLVPKQRRPHMTQQQASFQFFLASGQAHRITAKIWQGARCDTFLGLNILQGAPTPDDRDYKDLPSKRRLFDEATRRCK